MITIAKTTRKGSNPVSLVLCLVSCVLCLAQLTNTAAAAAYYVDASKGNDSYTGDSAHPWKTLDRVYTSYSGDGNKVQEGDTVYFRNGSYGTFRESTEDEAWNTYYMTRSDWITYKAATDYIPEINNIYVTNNDRRGILSNGNSYLIFDGFKIKDGAKFVSTNNIQIKNCIVTTAASTISGYYAPYFNKSYDNAIWAKDTNYVTIQNNIVTNAYKPIFVQYPANHTIISGNTCHHTGYGLTISGCNDVTVEDNYIYDVDNRRIYVGFYGTQTGTFQIGDTVKQSVEPGFTGIIGQTGNPIYIYITSATLPHRHDDVGGAGTITDIKTGATLTSITSVDPEHADGIEVATANSYYYPKNIIIRRNMCIFTYPAPWVEWNAAIKTGSQRPAYQQNVRIENNLCVGSQPTKFYSMRDVNLVNNVFYGGTSKFYMTNNGSDLIIDNMYNNIFSSLSIDADLDGYLTYIKNHGNNIFGTAFSDRYAGGPSYPFAVNNTELVNYNINSLFVNAANNDFNLAPGSIAINFGNRNYAPISDILGHYRDSSPDAGCYEYDGATQPPPSSKNSPPNAEAGGNRTLTDTDNNGSEQVILDGSGSSDSDGSIVSYEWTIDGKEPVIRPTPTLTVTLPIGRHTIMLKVTDDGEAFDTDTISITVEGMIGYWKFNEGTGAYASDSTGIGAAGRLINGPVWTAQGEISFDGNNDTVEITTAELSADRGSIALWANSDGFSKSKHSLFGHVRSGGNRIQLYCNTAGSLNVGLGSNAASSANIQNLNVHEWYHVALVWDQGNYKVYVDGVTRAVGTYTGLSSLATYADIGNSGNRSARNEGFDGIIDEVRLYNKPLSAAEIADIALVFLPIGDKSTAEGEELSFPVRTKSGSNAEISDSNLPSTPYFASNIFRWTPGYNASGVYEVEFTSPHGSSVDFERITVTVAESQQQGPVGYWRFDDIYGDIAYDSSATVNTGYLRNGLTWESGRINGAVAFSVPNDAVEIRTESFNPRTGTIAMWVYPQEQILTKTYLFGHADSSNANRIQLYLKYGKLCLGLGDSYETGMNIRQLNINQWYHIGLTWSNGTYNVYLNGLHVSSGTYSGLTELTGYADIGNNGTTRDMASIGKIDEVCVYNRALNSLEIAQLQQSN